MTSRPASTPPTATTTVELPRELTPAQYAADPRQARADAISGDHGKKVEAWRLAFKTTVAEIAGGSLELGASHEEQSLYHPIVSTPFFSLLIDTDHEDSGAMLRYRSAAGDARPRVRRELRLSPPSRAATTRTSVASADS